MRLEQAMTEAVAAEPGEGTIGEEIAVFAAALECHDIPEPVIQPAKLLVLTLSGSPWPPAASASPSGRRRPPGGSSRAAPE